VLVAFLIITGVSSLVLVVMVVGLVRHVRLLGGSLQKFREDVEPVVTGIRADAERARSRLENAAEAAQGLREPETRPRR
jgi:hypothetical protein